MTLSRTDNKKIFVVRRGVTADDAACALMEATLGKYLGKGFRIVESREGSLTGVTIPHFYVYMDHPDHPGEIFRLRITAVMYRNFEGFSDSPRRTDLGLVVCELRVKSYPGAVWAEQEGDYAEPILDVNTHEAGFNVLTLLRRLFSIIDEEGAHELTSGSETFSWTSVRSYAMCFDGPFRYDWKLDDVEPARLSPEQAKTINRLAELGRQMK